MVVAHEPTPPRPTTITKDLRTSLSPSVPKKWWLRESCSRIRSSGIGLEAEARDWALRARRVDSSSVIDFDEA